MNYKDFIFKKNDSFLFILINNVIYFQFIKTKKIYKKIN